MQKYLILKINGHTVLNFLDLQEHFSPWAVWEQREAFAAFAKVHSKPLASWLIQKSGVHEELRYLDKAFWLKLLERDLRGEAFPEGENASEVLTALIHDSFAQDLWDEKVQERLRQERALEQLDEKLNSILSGAGLESSPQDSWTAILLLAICQLAEMDARKQDFQRWTAPPQQERLAGQGQTEMEQSRGQHEVNQFPQADKVSLKARSRPYRYLYHTEETLSGQRIRTVRVEAVAGDCGARKAAIILCGPDGSRVLRIELAVGEYRDCTVCDGKVIGFLPTLSVHETQCLARKDYHSSEIRIIPRNGIEWQLSVDAETARKTTCFSAGDINKEGFLYIRDGKLMKAYYKPCENYTTRQKLDMIDDRLVEVRLVSGDYLLLTELGEVISSSPQWNGRTGVVTLYPRQEDAQQLAEQALEASDLREYARAGSCFAARTGDDRILLNWKKGNEYGP